MAESTAPVATLLFVDDEASILSSLKRLFRPHGYQILTAEGGEQGLQILAGQHIDLVISDMRMPQMDGARFLTEVRRQWPDTVRILLTGYADIESTIAAINQGEIYRYINKPWNDQEIVLIVREALERKRLERENGRLNGVVEAQNEELRQLNAGLEQTVAKRTEDLHKAIKLIQQNNTKLKTGFIATVQAFSGLVEMRAKNLAGHARRVADQTRVLAHRLGLDEAGQQEVMLASLLHDIGKIGLPDAILDKPVSALNREELARQMRHPEQGELALMQIEQLRGVAKLIRHHHECYDGSGFPDGLSGLAIPQGSRIIAVVNDYDALITGLLTQTPMRPKEALEYLIENRGKRYDPQVVDLYTGILAEQLKHVIDEIPLRPTSLKAGMVLSRDLMHRDGYMLLAKGYVVDTAIIQQLARIEVTEKHPLTLYVCKPDQPT